MKMKTKMPPNDLMYSGLDLTLLRRAFGHTVGCSTKATVPSQAAMSSNSDEVSSRLKDVQSAGNDGESHNLTCRPYGHTSAPMAGFNLSPTTIWSTPTTFLL